MPPTVILAESSALGLQQRRQRAGVSLEQIADRTKISIRFLKAIESEEFEKLPGGIFATSYLRQYAAAAGMDEAVRREQYQNQPNSAERICGAGAGSSERGESDCADSAGLAHWRSLIRVGFASMSACFCQCVHFGTFRVRGDS